MYSHTRLPKTIAIAVGMLVLSGGAAWAEGNPQVARRLRPGDVEKFVRTYPDMHAQYRSLQVESGSYEGKGLQLWRDVTGILNRHGWKHSFWGKLGAIANGVAYLRIEEVKQRGAPGVQSALRGLQQSPFIKDATKRQIRAEVRRAGSDVEQAAASFAQKVHPEDLALLRPHLRELKRVFDAIQ